MINILKKKERKNEREIWLYKAADVKMERHSHRNWSHK